MHVKFSIDFNPRLEWGNAIVRSVKIRGYAPMCLTSYTINAYYGYSIAVLYYRIERQYQL